MSKILDLNVFVEETLDIKLPAIGPDTGEVLHLEKPTQELVIKMMDFKSIRQNAKAEVIAERLNSMVRLILNTNNAGTAISADYVEKTLNVPMRTAIIAAYGAWISGIEQSPN